MGIQIAGSSTNTMVRGNIIGLAPDGITRIPNGQGVAIQGTATNVTIGGSTDSARNIISGNGNYGILSNATTTATSNISIQGNYIGLDKNGNVVTGSTQSNGIYASSPNGLLIGGSAVGEGNIISGNSSSGIYFTGNSFGQNFKIYGNTIGLKPNNETPAPNGLGISTGAMSTPLGSIQIGGSSPGQGNIISGNTSNGITLANFQSIAYPMSIKGNRIGLSASGVARPNANGIALVNTSNGVTVGGIGSNEGNLISGNSGSGVSMSSSTVSQVSVRGNSIYANSGLGIDLSGNIGNPDVWDITDADTGSNGLQNFARRTTLTKCDATTQQAATLWSQANTNYTVDFYANPSGRDPSGYGEGEQYISSTTVTTDAAGYAALTAPAATNLSMTATDPNGSTSEFSNERGATINGCGVTNKATSDSTPPLSGTVSLSGFTAGVTPTKATITVNGQSADATISGSTWTLADNTLSTIPDGTYNVTMTVTDPESKLATSYTATNALSIDSTQPTASITRKSGQAAYTQTNSAWFALTLSEAAATGTLTASDINPGTTTGTVTTLTKIDATHYEFEVTGMTSGNTVTPSIAAGAFADANGNNNVASTGDANNWVMYDTIAPQTFAIGVDITSSGHDLNHPLVSWSTTDGQSGIDHYTMSVDGGAFTTVSSPQSLTLAPASSHTIVVRAYDRAGNMREKTVIYPPIENIIAPTTLSNVPITNTTIKVEGPTGMVITNVSITGAGSSGFTCTPTPGPATTVTVTCTGGQITQTGTLTVTATTDAGVTTQNTQDYVIDTIAPSVTVNQAPGQADPTNVNSAKYRVVFSEPINESTFTATDMVLSGTSGTVTGFTKIDNRTWDVTVTGMTNGDTVTATLPAARVTDPAGNNNTVSTSSDNQVTYDTTQPTVTINQASGQADPTNQDSATFTIVFSKPVVGFTASGIMLSGTSGAVTNLTTADNKTFTATVTGMTSGDKVKAIITANVVTDAAGNANIASTSTDNEVIYDNTPPIATIKLLTTNNTRPALSGTVDDPTATVVVNVNGINYTAINHGDGTWALAANTITALADGAYNIAVTATDAAGNVGTNNADNVLTIDTAAPTGTVEAVSPSIVNSPALTGTVDDLTATITVVINGQQYPATNHGDGTWSLAAGSIQPGLLPGNYTATVHFEDAATNATTQTLTFTVLRADADIPTVTATEWVGGQPILTGTYDSANSQTLRITVGGKTYQLGTDARLSAQGDTWRLDLTTLSPALEAGTYDVVVSVTTRDGSVISDTSSDELQILAPTPINVITHILAPNTGSRKAFDKVLVSLAIAAGLVVVLRIFIRSTRAHLI